MSDTGLTLLVMVLASAIGLTILFFINAYTGVFPCRPFLPIP